MQFKNLIAASLFSAAAFAQIPPTSFGFPSAPTELYQTFQNGRYNTTPGVNYGPGVAFMPQLGLQQSPGPDSQQYVVLTVDPDARFPENPTARFYLHWLQPGVRAARNTTAGGFPYALSNTTQAAVPFLNPMPPPTSNPHRYITYLFRQPNNFAVPQAFSQFNSSNRGNFNLTQFISAASLGSPVAANYFYCSNMTSVPALYSAAPGAGFPRASSSGMLASTGMGGAGAVPATRTGAAGSSSMRMTGAPTSGRAGGAATSTGTSRPTTLTGAAAVATGNFGVAAAVVGGLALLGL